MVYRIKIKPKNAFNWDIKMGEVGSDQEKIWIQNMSTLKKDSQDRSTLWS